MPDYYTANCRSAILNEPRLQSSTRVMQTPFGNVRSQSGLTVTDRTSTTVGGGNVPSSQLPPPIPPSPLQSSQSVQSAISYGNRMGLGGIGTSMLSNPYGLGSLGTGLGYGGYGGYGGFSGYGGYGGYSGYGPFNRFGTGGMYSNPNDPENQFIRLAEESSRPAFQSIESLVAAIGNIAAMLDSTFFAITSSFRAILGVAANFGRLRGVFAQFWQTFAICRALEWIYKKLLYWLRLSKIDPSRSIFNEAFVAATSYAASGSNVPPTIPSHIRSQSPWPILIFITFIFTAPYVIMKLIGNIANTAQQESRNPKTWIRPIRTRVLYDFNARNPSELTVRAGQVILVASREVQNTHSLLNSGWVLASTNNETSGIIPSNYLLKPKLFQQQLIQSQQPVQVSNNNVQTIIDTQNNNQEIDSNKEINTETKLELNESKIFNVPIPPIFSGNHNSNGSTSPLHLSRRNSTSSLPAIPEVDDNGEIIGGANEDVDDKSSLQCDK